MVAFPAGKDVQGAGLSRREVAEELLEHREDLHVFTQAYDLIKMRVQSAKDGGRMMGLVNWSGTYASLGTLELCMSNIRNVVEDLRDVLQRIDAGVIPNTDEE